MGEKILLSLKSISQAKSLNKYVQTLLGFLSLLCLDVARSVVKIRMIEYTGFPLAPSLPRGIL